jgi:hypothetical protein
MALCALLRAERETRSAFEEAIAAGEMKPEVLLAILGDPVPVITQDDLNFAEWWAATHLPKAA